jgi:hypothetical protein
MVRPGVARPLATGTRQHADRREAIMTEYVLTTPLEIGPRLMPSIAIDPGSETGGRISAEIIGYDEGPRAKISYFVDFPGGEYYGNDVSVSPLYADSAPADIVREGIATLCRFLTAEAEAYQGSGNMGANEPIDGWLFSPEVAEWAYLNSGELAMAELELRGDDQD